MRLVFFALQTSYLPMLPQIWWHGATEMLPQFPLLLLQAAAEEDEDSSLGPTLCSVHGCSGTSDSSMASLVYY